MLGQSSHYNYVRSQLFDGLHFYHLFSLVEKKSLLIIYLFVS